MKSFIEKMERQLLEKELIKYLEEQLANSYFHSDVEANKAGYKCCLKDIRQFFELEE